MASPCSYGEIAVSLLFPTRRQGTLV